MGVEITCDGCSKGIGGDVFCEKCADEDAGAPLSERAEDEVIELSAAIACGDLRAAADALDRIAGHVDGWDEMVARGRYGRRAAA